MMVLVEGPVLRKALRKFSEEVLIVIGSIILGLNFILFISNQAILVYCAAVLFALGNGLMWPSLLSLLSKRGGKTHQGGVQGVAGSFGSLASIIGLTVGGFLYHFLEGSIFLISAAVIFTDYVLYPNGTVDIHVICSNNPFRLETEIDRSRIIAFCGQVRDRLIILLRDERERIVPDIMDWYMTECDINKDIKLSHLLHLSAIKVQSILTISLEFT